MYPKLAFLLSILFACALVIGCSPDESNNKGDTDSSEDSEGTKQKKVVYRDNPIPVSKWRLPDENFVGTQWESEHWNNIASAQLNRLGNAIVDAKKLQPAQIQQQIGAVFTSDASFSGLQRADLVPLFKDKQLNVVGAGKDASVDQAWQVANSVEAIGKMISPWNKCNQRRFVFEIDNVVMHDKFFVTDTLVSIIGKIPNVGARQASMKWKVRWEFGADKKNARIKAIRIDSYDEATLLNPATEIYSDCTRAVFENTKEANKQFSYGISRWTEKLGTRRIMGWHGICICDVNGDDLDDIYVSQPEGIPNRLFIQVKDGSVRDVSLQSGLAFQESTGASLFADLDNDGDQDALVSLQAGVALMANDGKGRFHYKQMLFNAPNATNLSVADFDQDGDLDLLCAAYLPQYRPDSDFPAFDSVFDAANGGGLIMYVNKGNLSFKLITESAGVKNKRFITNAFWHDMDFDGDLDIIGANDFAPVTYLSNKGDWFAKEKIAPALEKSHMYRSFNWIDLNADGEKELIVSTGSTPANRRVSNAYSGGEEFNLTPDELKELVQSSFVMRLNKDRQYEVAERLTPVASANFTLSSSTLDINGDGLQDLLSVNSGWTRFHPRNLSGFFWRNIIPRFGRENSTEKRSALSDRFFQFSNEFHAEFSYEPYKRNSLLLNTGRNRLVDISAISGLDDVLDTRSIARTDWDSDGDWDVVQFNALAPMVKIKRNETPVGKFVKIKLRGTTTNRDGYGAIVSLFLKGSDSPQVQTSKCEATLLTQSSPDLIFSIPENGEVEKVVVKWSARKVEEYFGFEVNQTYRVTEGNPQIQSIQRPAPTRFVPGAMPAADQFVTENLIWPKLKGPVLEIKAQDEEKWRLYSGNGKNTIVYLCRKTDKDFSRNLSQLNSLDKSLRKMVFQVDGMPSAKSDSVEMNQIAPSSVDRLGIFGLEVFSNVHSFQTPCWILFDDLNRMAAVYRNVLDVQSLKRDIEITANVRDDFYHPYPLYKTKRVSNLLVPDYIRLAEVYARTKYSAEAVRMRLLSREQLALARCQIAQTYIEQGNILEAQKMINESIGFNRNCREAYLLNGKINLKLASMDPNSSENRLEFAARSFSQTLKIDDDNIDARVGLAQVAERQGKYDEAIGIIDAAIRKTAQQSLVIDMQYRLNWIKGRLLFRKKEYRKAAEALTKAFDLRPIEVSLVTDLALVYAEAGDFENALRFFRLARRLSPNEIGFTRVIGVCCFLTARDKDAIEELQKVVDKASRDYTSKLMLAWILATSPKDELRDGKRAMKLIKPIYDIFGDTESVFKEVYAAVLAENGDVQAARKQQLEALEMRRKKVKLKNQTKYLEGMQSRLTTYRADSPMRMKDRNNHPFPRITDVQNLTGMKNQKDNQ